MDSGSVDRYIVARGVLVVPAGASRCLMHQNPSAFDPRKYLKDATKAMSEICVARYEAFGTAGHASKIRSVDLENVVKRYDSGELDPRVN